MSSNPNRYEENFEQLGIIGEGGFGKVFKVKEKSTGTLFAIKRIQIKTDLNEILKEIRILSKVRSDYVVNYIDHWNEEKEMDSQPTPFVYIQMELCSQNLGSIIGLINASFDDRFKTIKYYIRTKLFIGIIECLNHLHSMTPPISHRDLTPQNILLTDGINERIVKLCDFGLSKSLESSKNTTNVGTQYYMAPEIADSESFDTISGKSRYNEKCDIYSLGVIATKLFELKDSVKKIRELKQDTKDKYSAEYSDESLNEKFPKLLETISNMLSKDLKIRPDCPQLLAKTHEWTIDQNIVRSDGNYEQFINITQNNDKLKVLQRL